MEVTTMSLKIMGAGSSRWDSKVRGFLENVRSFPCRGGLGALFLSQGPVRAGRREMAASFRREGVMVMKHTIDEMKAKIHEMYPKIDKHGVACHGHL